jgi:ComF family protein
MLKAFHNSLLSIIYPQECSICSRQVIGLDAGAACASCWENTRFFDGTEMLCAKCGTLLGITASPSPVLCRKCDDHHYDRAMAVGVYENALAASILNLKKVPHLPGMLRTAVVKRMRERIEADVIIPIPLSRQRLHERGFNQADVIAMQLGDLTGFVIDRSSLNRKLHTPAHRIGMDQRARELTVVKAFEVVRPKLIEGKKILLVDDVFTSGSTASSCARVLKKEGAAEVNVFTLARAVMH